MPVPAVIATAAENYRFNSGFLTRMISDLAPAAEDASYPSPAAMIDSWTETSKLLAAALETVSEEALAQPSVKGPPSADGKISGVINFLAIHETYHIGQASYLRGWLGHKGLMG